MIFPKTKQEIHLLVQIPYILTPRIQHIYVYILLCLNMAPGYITRYVSISLRAISRHICGQLLSRSTYRYNFLFVSIPPLLKLQLAICAQLLIPTAACLAGSSRGFYFQTLPTVNSPQSGPFSQLPPSPIPFLHPLPIPSLKLHPLFP